MCAFMLFANIGLLCLKTFHINHSLDCCIRCIRLYVSLTPLCMCVCFRLLDELAIIEFQQDCDNLLKSYNPEVHLGEIWQLVNNNWQYWEVNVMQTEDLSIHPFSSAYSGPGHQGSRPSRAIGHTSYSNTLQLLDWDSQSRWDIFQQVLGLSVGSSKKTSKGEAPGRNLHQTFPVHPRYTFEFTRWSNSSPGANNATALFLS